MTKERLQSIRRALQRLQGAPDPQWAGIARDALVDLEDLSAQQEKGSEHARLLSL